jgi:hypothetical protein
LRAEDDTMFVDSEGRYITAGQWHDEKFKAFTDPWQWQAMAPTSMILGGMQEAGSDDPQGEPEQFKPSPIVMQEELKEVAIQA